MGILESTTRLLGCKREDEDGERTIYPYAILQNHDDYPSSSSKIFTFHCLIYKAVKTLFQKILFIFYPWRPSENTDPNILPIKNPCPTINKDPSLFVISSPSNDSSSESDLNTNDREFQCDINVDVVSSQNLYSANGNNFTDDPIPDFTYSLASTSRASEEIACSAHVFVEEIGPQNVPFQLEQDKLEEEKVVDERWIKHYSSRHRILLVGEGDFSFSSSLALAFGLASNMIATSLDSKAFLKKNYQNAPFNIMELRSRECKVMHGIDATKMANHALLGNLKFDRIVFNFPFAGFFKNLSRDSQLRRHRRLVSLFLKNAREMISENGEIHISHKTNDFHVEWKLESIASSHRLRLIEAVKFHHLDYPGYNTKCGFGGDNNFYCHPSNTYKFGLKTVRY